MRSNIAKPNLVLSVISQLSKVAPNGRRLLLSADEVPEDYKVKSAEGITILETDERYHV